MTIRRARATDAPAILAIWNAIIRDTDVTFTAQLKTPAEIDTLLTSRPVVYAAEHGGTTVGFATYGPFRGGDGYRHTMEHTVYLAPEAQGLGLGRGLLTALEAHASTQNVHSMIAGISGTNAAAVAFHTALGYAEVGRIADAGRKFDRWIDLILMQKRLPRT